MPQPRFKSPAECYAWFRAQGINFSAWCRERGINRQIAVDLMHGKLKGYRGETHRIAVILGLKADPSVLEPGPSSGFERRQDDRRHSGDRRVPGRTAQ